MYADGMSSSQIADFYGCSQGPILKRLRDLGVTLINPQAKGPDSPFWQGGKHKDNNGYVRVVNWEHPRAWAKSGEVFEHTLVMETHLGRYLLPGENVHHKNGIRDDNRIENLELRIKPQESGIRPVDAVKHAREIIKLYGDEEDKECQECKFRPDLRVIGGRRIKILLLSGVLQPTEVVAV
jgi:hypothetical protein